MSRDHTINVLLGLAGLVVIQLLAGSPVSAQQQSGASATLEEVVVTSRRREESLQDIPIAITALTTEQLALRGIDRMEDLDVYVPNVSLMGGGSEGEAEGSFVMRGIPGIGTYVDGIWQGPQGDGLLTMNVVEVDRIEVLRGPQGTLFGKNTVGGAIQYVTRPPAEEFGARIKIVAGDFDRRDVTASVDVPLSDTVLTKFTAAQLTRDGFIESLSINRAYGDVNDTVVRGDLLWTPSDTFSLRFSAEINEIDRNGPARVQNDIVLTCTKPGHPANFCGSASVTRPDTYNVVGLPYTPATHVAGFPGGEVGEYETKSDYNVNGIVQDFDRYTLDMTWELTDNISLKSLTGVRDMYRRTYIDFGADEYDLFTRDRYRETEFFSQEFQFLGTIGDRIDWVGGVYYWDYEEVTRELTYSFVDFRDDPTTSTVEGAALVAALAASGETRPLSPGPRSSMDGLENDGLAFFGEVNFALSDRLDLTVGVRFNDEDVTSFSYTATGAQLNPARPDTDLVGCIFCRTTDQTLPTEFDATTPRVALSYSASDSVMIYGSYAEGFGAGGIEPLNIPGLPSSLPFDPEETESVEIGLRGDFFDDRFRLNATFFATTWDKIQVSETLPDPTNPGQNLPEAATTNAGTADADGFELEGVLLVSDNFQIDFTVGVLDTEYTSVGQATQITVGDTFQQAPDLTYSIGLQFNAALANGGGLITRLDYGFVDDYVRVRESQRQSFQESYAKVNARFTYEPPDSNWRLSVFGTNLTDERYLNSGFLSTGFAFDLATVARPREIGASMEFFFD